MLHTGLLVTRPALKAPISKISVLSNEIRVQKEK